MKRIHETSLTHRLLSANHPHPTQNHSAYCCSFQQKSRIEIRRFFQGCVKFNGWISRIFFISKLFTWRTLCTGPVFQDLGTFILSVLWWEVLFPSSYLRKTLRTFERRSSLVTIFLETIIVGNKNGDQTKKCLNSVTNPIECLHRFCFENPRPCK